jgi:hypothetical protein
LRTGSSLCEVQAPFSLIFYFYFYFFYHVALSQALGSFLTRGCWSSLLMLEGPCEPPRSPVQPLLSDALWDGLMLLWSPQNLSSVSSVLGSTGVYLGFPLNQSA